MAKTKGGERFLGKAGKLLGKAGSVFSAGMNFYEGAQDGDLVRGAVKTGGGIAGGILGGAIGSAAGPVGVGVGGLVGNTAGGEAAVSLYDNLALPRQKATTGLSGIAASAKKALQKQPLHSLQTQSQTPKQQPGGWRFGANNPELSMGEMQYKLGTQALQNQGAIASGAQYNERVLGLGNQYTDRFIAGTMANRDIGVTRLNTGRDIKVAGLMTNRDIVVNRDQVRGNVDMTRLNTGRDIVVNRDQVRGNVDMTRLNTGRDIAVTGLTTNRDIVVNRDQVRGNVDMTRLNTEAQKYLGGSGNLKTTTAKEIALGDQYTQRYVGGSGNYRTAAQIELGRIQAGVAGRQLLSQASSLDNQMRAAQIEGMQTRNAAAQLNREMLDYQKKRDQDQYNLQQFGLIASMYG